MEVNTKQTLTLGEKNNEKIKLICPQCRQATNHTIIQSALAAWDMESAGIMGRDDYIIATCNGCEALQFCKKSSDSETYDYTFDPVTGEPRGPVYTETIRQYPSVNIDYEKPGTYMSMPVAVKVVAMETHEALCCGLKRLAAAGSRMVIETICSTNDISNGNLKAKINKLADKGIITEDMKVLLHKVRLFGNDQVHTESDLNDYDLINAWSAVCNLLRSIYGTKDTASYLKAFSEDDHS